MVPPWALVMFLWLGIWAVAVAQFAPAAMPNPAVGTYTGTVYDSLEGPLSTNHTMVFGATQFSEGSFTTGPYTYTKTGANTATLAYTANTVTTNYTETEISTAYLTFTSTYGGTYTMSGSYNAVYYGEAFSGTLSNGSGVFTLRTLPAAQAPTSAAVQATSATLGGTVTSDGGTALTHRGVVCCPQSVSSMPYTGGPGVTTFNSAGALGSFTVNATGLLPGTAYVFRAFAENNVGTAYSETATFTTPTTLPTVAPLVLSGIYDQGLTVAGSVTADGGLPILERGVVFSLTTENNSPTLIGSGVLKVTTSGALGAFSMNAWNLFLPASQYSCCGYATNSLGTAYGAVSTFTTLNGTPLVDTPTHANITASTVTLGGTVLAAGGSTVVERGVVYAPTAVDSFPRVNETGTMKVVAGGTTGVFTTAVSGLQPGTSYSFAAYASNSGHGISYSPVAAFTTLAVLPSVTAPTSASVTATTALLGGNVTSNGGDMLTARGVLCAPTAINNNPDFGGAGVLHFLASGTSTGVFTVAAAGLTANTAYSFRAYATNSAGTAFTTTVGSFTTTPGPPLMTTTTVSSITGVRAVAGGTVSSDNGAAITQRGVVWSQTSVNNNPVIGGPGVTQQAAAGAVGTPAVATLTGLTPGTSYSFRAYATNSAGTAYTEPVATFTTLSLPTVVLPTVADITATQASLGATITDGGGEATLTYGVVWSTVAENSDPVLGGPGIYQWNRTGAPAVYTANVNSLRPGTAYVFKIYATNTVGTVYTNAVIFTTLTAPPVITLPTSTAITSTTATLGGRVDDSGGLPVTRGVVYAPTTENSSPELGGPGVVDGAGGTSTGVFSVAISGLVAGTSYSFRAYASNSMGTVYTSPVSTFTTHALPALSPPSASSIGFTSATLNSQVQFLSGNAPVTERGFVYALTTANGDPVIDGPGVTLLKDAAGGIGSFSVSAMGLTPGAAYTFKAYAINSVGTAYSASSATFVTLGRPLMSNPTVAGITPSSATLGGAGTVYSGYTITEYGFVYALTAVNPNPMIDGAGVTWVGRAGSAGAFTQVVTGLTPGTSYSFKAYAINSAGTAYTEPAGTFVTLEGPPNPPTIADLVVTNITLTGARGTANITSMGDSSVTERGLVVALASVNNNPEIGGTGVTKTPYVNTGTGTFSVNLTGLLSGSVYVLRAYATNSVGTAYTSPALTFTTLGLPVLSAPTVSGVTTTAATLGGHATYQGSYSLTERGVVYAVAAVNSDPMAGGVGVTRAVRSGTSTGAFTQAVSGLLPGTAYVFRAYATNTLGTTHTAVTSFTTLTQAQSWRQTHFGTVENTGSAADTADQDNDGLPNLIEYAFGLNPTQGGSRLLPAPQHAGGALVLTFTEPAGVGGSGLTYGARWSPSLQSESWIAVPDTGSGTTHIFSVPTSGQSQGFLQMTVTPP